MSQPVVLTLITQSANTLNLDQILPTLIVPDIAVTGPQGDKGDKGDKGNDGRGFLSQTFVATEGQTVFDVDFDLNDYYVAMIDYAPQSHDVVTRSGNTITTAVPLSEGQILIIMD